MHEEPTAAQMSNPESIAYRLMLDILAAEGRGIGANKTEGGRASRNLILDAYADCLAAVLGKRETRSTIRRVAE